MCVKRVNGWSAKDGSIHPTEREALISSIGTVIDEAMPLTLSRWVLTAIIATVPTLMPLLIRLQEPRNAPPRPATREPMRDEGDLLAIDATADAPPLEWGASHDIDVNDLRPGQLVEEEDGRTLIIGQIICDNQPEPIIEIAPGDDDEFKSYVPCSSVRRIIAQPEELLDLDAARALLAELEEGVSPADEVALNHKRKILLHRRIAELEKESTNGQPS
jgi:hypothetical protein